MPEPNRPLKVFLSYASQDKPLVRELSRRLVGEGWIDTWQDEKSLLPGQDWRVKIEEAVEGADVVIICLSNQSVSKEGHVQKELRYAREIALEKPEDAIFLIPLRLDECEVPRGLRFYQWVDYFGENKDSSYKALVASLSLRYEQKIKAEEAERLRNELQEREIAERVAREKAEKDASEKARLKVEKEERQRIAKEKADREAADRLARKKAEKARLEAEELARQKSAKEKAEREVTERAEKERKVKELRDKQAREAREKEKRESEKKEEKPVAVKPNTGGQIAYWFGGFIVLVLGAILLTSLDNTPSTPKPAQENTQTQEIATSPQNTVAPSTTLVSETTSTPINNKSLTPFGENSPFELVFVSNEGDYMNLYQLRNNGEKRNLTENSQFDLIAQPSLSSDGKIIAFETDEGLFGIHIDTTSTELISSFGHKPQWNPTSNEVVFVSDKTELRFDTCGALREVHPNGMKSFEIYWNCVTQRSSYGSTVLSNQQMYLIDLVSNEPKENIKPLIDYRGVDFPMWDYTGTKLAYIKNENVDFICVDDVKDKSKVVRIDCHQSKDFVNTFDFSPVSNEIVYAAEWKGVSNIYLLDTDDFSQTDLTTGTNNNYFPIWSHSGEQIAFMSDRDGNNEIYIMDIASSSIKNLTLNASNDFSPIWAPDDGEIIFISDRSGNLDIYSVDVSTLEVENLTNTSNDELFPLIIPLTLPLQ